MGLNRYFINENIQMASKHMKRCLKGASIVMREMLTEATIKYHNEVIKIAKIKKINDIKHFQGC